MKRFIIITIIVLASFTQLIAQPQQSRPPQKRMSGDLEDFQMQLLIKQLDIEESIVDSFKKIYAQYFEAMNELRPQRPQRQRESKLSDEEVEAQILESFDLAEQTTALKKEYYAIFKSILTPQQILKMYNIERQLMERINSEMQNRSLDGGTKPRGNR